MTVYRETGKGINGDVVLDSINTQVSVINSEGTVLQSNAAWKKFTESSDLKPISHTNFWDILISHHVSPIVLESLKNSILAIQSGKEQFFSLDYCTRQNLREFWYSIRINAIQNSGYLAITQADISSRKHVESQLRESEQNYHSLFNVMQEGLIGFTTKGSITLVNPGFLSLVSKTEEALIGNAVSGLFPEIAYFLSNSDLNDETFEFEELLSMDDERSRYVHVSIFPDQHNKGQFFAFVRDISLYKQIQLNQTIAIQLAQIVSNNTPELSDYLEALSREISKQFREVKVSYRSVDDLSQQATSTETRGIEEGIEHVLITEIALTQRNSSFSTKDLNKRGVSMLPEGFHWVGAPVYKLGKVFGVLLLRYGAGQIYSEEANIQFVSTLAQQITSLISQSVLHEDKERVFTISHDLICVLKNDRFLLVINPAFERTLGYTMAELREYPIEHFVHTEDHIELNRAFEQLRSGVAVNQLVLRFFSKTGEIRRIAWNATGDELRSSYYCIGRDVSEELNAIDQLQESEAQYRGIFERINEGLLFLDKDGNIQSVNPGMCRMIQTSAEALLQQNAIDLIDNERQRNNLQAIIKKGTTTKFNAFDTSLRVGNTRKEVQISVYPRQLDGSLSQGLMVVVTDISQLRKLENDRMNEQKLFSSKLEEEVLARTSELERAKNELAISLEKEKELGELKSRFVATASHQFRTPLSVIQSNLGILEMQKDLMSPEFQQKFLKANTRIIEQINKMTGLMNDVLILGKISAGSIANRPVPTLVNELIEKIINSYNHIDQQKRILLEHSGENRKWEIDPSILEHAISNLISNAVKYSPEGAPINVRIETKSEELIIQVADKGIGIPESELPHIFEPFYRASNALDISGTGLGMAITKEYIELIGGQITVSSLMKEGTTFTITLK